jgi:hypothetical protein
LCSLSAIILPPDESFLFHFFFAVLCLAHHLSLTFVPTPPQSLQTSGLCSALAQ